MSDLIAIAYPDLATAQDVAANALRLQKSHELELEDLVVVERKDDGKVKLHQPSTAAGGAVTGALWGGLIGLIFFMPLFGMAIGAASGAAGGALADYGIDDKFMKELGAELGDGRRRGLPPGAQGLAGQGAAADPAPGHDHPHVAERGGRGAARGRAGRRPELTPRPVPGRSTAPGRRRLRGQSAAIAASMAALPT